MTERARRREIDEQTFRDEMRRLALAAIALAFALGGGSEEVEGAAGKLAEQRRLAEQSAEALADSIYSGEYDELEETERTPGQTDERGQERLAARLGLWVVTMAGIYALGQVHTPPRLDSSGEITEQAYMWQLGNTVQHCTDCASLDGQIHTAEEWRRAGIMPQSPDLECGGWNCDCRLVPVDEPSIGFTF